MFEDFEVVTSLKGDFSLTHAAVTFMGTAATQQESLLG